MPVYKVRIVFLRAVCRVERFREVRFKLTFDGLFVLAGYVRAYQSSSRRSNEDSFLELHAGGSRFS